ncbi:clan AA aspartic protease [Saccharolobus solfataricus]|uniref:Clan AA aspartic protease n=2 Tax=Saccharolobus solfataricus TaxID=2287 RepID=A0A0E3JYE7_SACSO|nr:clan AA aspartic protease [Saccharolobus solfataricus]AKA74472.1 clan AA aspartic protease [Saccharolobus solfataricus]AKA77167.1 clan AA aspartic protease [Saccharolobus solfataricus]AKA79859.1 clan AA aspartic protease [Saccharolobus solfataricus]AZF68950.1 clan AA aspartic protease [Saccharolobus solfataricus]AZF71570.1 clan AA aspartic protease [Saccharolobus solfataricus]
MDFELETEGIKVRAKVDTGFDGEIIVTKEIFDKIPYNSSDGTRICTASMECYSTFVKLVRTKFLGREITAEVLNSPVIEKNIIGEGLLKKVSAVINYKDNKIEDP